MSLVVFFYLKINIIIINNYYSTPFHTNSFTKRGPFSTCTMKHKEQYATDNIHVRMVKLDIHYRQPVAGILVESNMLLNNSAGIHLATCY